ncbi:hypothetical protein GQ472_06105 [archaeon]|nr:hypothetical protein [archaeon]
MAVNDIKVRFKCEKCNKKMDRLEHGIFSHRGELETDLRVRVPKGWISLDMFDNRSAIGKMSSHDFCSYKCLIEYFRGKEIQDIMVDSESGDGKDKKD